MSGATTVNRSVSADQMGAQFRRQRLHALPQRLALVGEGQRRALRGQDDALPDGRRDGLGHRPDDGAGNLHRQERVLIETQSVSSAIRFT